MAKKTRKAVPTLPVDCEWPERPQACHRVKRQNDWECIVPRSPKLKLAAAV